MPEEPYRGPDAAPRPPTGRRRSRSAADEPDLTDLRTELEDLRRRVQQNDDEIDAMQITAAQASQAGEVRGLAVLRSPAVLISLLSLLLAFGTTILSSMRLDADRQHEARTELTAYIERLADIPRRQAEIIQQHPGPEAGNLLAELNAEAQSIAYQARNVIRSIPDQVATVEYTAVGYSLQSSGALDDAQEMYQLGLNHAVSPSDRVYALRALAYLRYLVRDYDGGRDLYGQAREVYTKVEGAPELVVANDNASTELLWASAELAAGFCTDAASHVNAARQIMAAVPLSNLESLLQQLDAGMASCIPLTAASPGAT